MASAYNSSPAAASAGRQPKVASGFQYNAAADVQCNAAAADIQYNVAAAAANVQYDAAAATNVQYAAAAAAEGGAQPVSSFSVRSTDDHVTMASSVPLANDKSMHVFVDRDSTCKATIQSGSTISPSKVSDTMATPNEVRN